jgi:hypothetical protein
LTLALLKKLLESQDGITGSIKEEPPQQRAAHVALLLKVLALPARSNGGGGTGAGNDAAGTLLTPLE